MGFDYNNRKLREMQTGAAGLKAVANKKVETPMPKAPDLWGPGASNDYRMNTGAYTRGDDAFSALDNYARAPGASPWAKMAEQDILQRQAGQMDDAGRQADLAGASAMSDLAMTGGLDSGARERLATQARLGRMNAQQGISRSTGEQLTGLGVQDQGMKLDTLKALPGMGMAKDQFKAGLKESNIARDMNAKMFGYEQQMKAYTGDKMAKATAASGGKK